MAPGYKKKDIQDPENYIYFAMCCTLAKNIRRAITNRLYFHICNGLPESFYGFITGKGTMDAHHVLRRVIEEYIYSLNEHLLFVSYAFYQAYDKIYHEALEAAFSAWGIPGQLQEVLSSLFKSQWEALGVGEAPDSELHYQFRGLPTGAPEAPVVFLMLAAWFDAGRGAWESFNPPSPEPLIARASERNTLPALSVTYADDRNEWHTSPLCAQYDADYIFIVGPYLGSVLNTCKCIIRWIVAKNKCTDCTAKRVHLHRALPPPHVYIGQDEIPSEGPIEVLGGGVFCEAGAAEEIVARKSETHEVTRSFCCFLRGASMSKWWIVRHLEGVTGSKFTYGLQSFPLNEAEEDRIDAFQARSLRAWCREPPLRLAPPQYRRST